MVKLKRLLFSITAALIFALTLVPGANVKAQESVPKINFVGVDHSPLIEGDKESFYITSKGTNEKVQYRFFIYSAATKKWTTLGEYTEACDPKVPYKFNYDVPFKSGKYQLSIWVKRYGKKGIVSSPSSSYDTKYTVNLNCVTPTEADRVRSDGAMITDKDEYTLGETVKVLGVENIRGRKGPYTFRLHQFNATTGEWTLDKETYRENIEWTPEKPGVYVLDLWGISSNTVHTERLKKDPMSRYYDIWKLKVITVKGEDNTGKYMTPKSEIALMKTPGLDPDERHLLPGKQYKILEHKGLYYKIKVGSQFGYIHMDDADIIKNPSKDKMTLAWQQLSSANYKTDKYLTYVSKKSTDIGLDAISPTWFYLEGSSSNPSSITVGESGNMTYVQAAHRNGFEVWARLAETYAKTDRLDVIFKDPVVRNRVIDQTIAYAKKYNVDGINLDIEAIGNTRKDGYTAFCKELYTRLKKENLTVSMDVMTPEPWSQYYNLPVTKDYMDYIAVMAYDEHYAGSKEPGSVGSYSWVEKAITGSLSLGVPNEKLILGVPFYLRDYTILDVNNSYDSIMVNKQAKVYKDASGNSSNIFETCTIVRTFPYTGTQGNYYAVDYDGFFMGFVSKSDATFIPANTRGMTVIGNYARTMQGAKDSITENNGSTRYDEDARQTVGEYTIDGSKHIVWLEDTSSMGWRLDLANKYNLGGIGAWSLGWETPDIWDTIKTKFNK